MEEENIVNELVIDLGGGVPHVFFCLAVVLVLAIMTCVIRALWVKQKRGVCSHEKILALVSPGDIDDCKCYFCGQKFKYAFVDCGKLFDNLQKK